MSRLLVPRMLAAGSLASSTTAFRVGACQLALLSSERRALVKLAVQASVGGPGAGQAQAEFRDDLLALARDSAEASWRELRRGVDDFDAFSRPREERARGAAPSLPGQAVTTGAVASDDVIAELGATAEISRLRERIAEWLESVDDELREPLSWALAGAPKHFRPLTLFACHRALLRHAGLRGRRARVRGRADAQHVADRRRRPGRLG